jgi:hypothetical protein
MIQLPPLSAVLPLAPISAHTKVIGTMPRSEPKA